MKVRAIRYGRLRSLAGHNHVKLEKEIEIEDGEDDETVFNALQAEIDVKLGLMEDCEDLQARYERLQEIVERTEQRARQLCAERDALYRAIDQAQAFVAAAQKAGIELPKSVADIADDAIPF